MNVWKPRNRGFNAAASYAAFCRAIWLPVHGMNVIMPIHVIQRSVWRRS